MTLTQKHLLSAGITFILFGFLFLLFSVQNKVQASAPFGLPATMATTSNPAVTSTASLVFATTTACSARVITTYASPVMITFSQVQGSIPTATFGHLQAASTTVAYDSGLYGCGAVEIYSFTNQSITVSESR